MIYLLKISYYNKFASEENPTITNSLAGFDEKQPQKEPQTLVLKDRKFHGLTMNELYEQIHGFKSTAKKQILIFDNCEIQNFSLFFMNLINYCRKHSSITNIKFVDCSPLNELPKNQKEIYGNIGVEFTDSNSKEVDMINIPDNNNTFFLFKKENFIGYSLFYNYLKIFRGLPEINFLKYYSPSSYQEQWSYYFLQDFFTEINYDQRYSDYFLQSVLNNYFKKFYQRFLERILEANCASYSIIIFNNFEERESALESFKSSRDLTEWANNNQHFTPFYAIKNVFNFPKQKYLFLNNSAFKRRMKDLFLDFQKNQTQIITNQSNESCVSWEINQRPVIVFDIKFLTLKKVFDSEKVDHSEKKMFKSYKKFGVNFLIFQLMQNQGLSLDKALEQVLDCFLEFFIFHNI